MPTDVDTGASLEAVSPEPTQAQDEDSGGIRGAFAAAQAEGMEKDTEEQSEAQPPQNETQAGTEVEGQPEKLYAGKYRTTEDFEKGYTELQALIDRQGQELGELRKLKEKAPEKNPDPEVENKETLEAETDFTDLTADELDQIREDAIDEYGERLGKEKFREFQALIEKQKISKAVNEQLKPIQETIEPLVKKQNELSEQEKTLQRETYFAETAKKFGDEFESLQKKFNEPGYVEKFLAGNPMEEAIKAAAQSDPIKAHRMILWEMKNANVREEHEKRKKSMPADLPTGKTVPRRDESAPEGVRGCLELAKKQLGG